MVSKYLIEKTLNQVIINKCSPSAKARRIGASVTESHSKRGGVDIVSYNYNNGTVIELEKNRPVTIYQDKYDTEGYETVTTMFGTVKFNGKEYKLTFGDSNLDKETDKTFDYQKDFIIEHYGEEGWDFFCEYSNQFGTYQGWNLNSLLRGYKNLSDVTDEDGDFYISPFLLDNHDRFVEMENSLPLDNEDFISLRLVNDLYRNTSIGKKVVSDKAHTSASTIGELSHYDTYGDHYNGWFVFTINEKDSGVKGAYLGQAIREADGYDFEREINYAPDQEFERLLIDEKNKFIIQQPI